MFTPITSSILALRATLEVQMISCALLRKTKRMLNKIETSQIPRPSSLSAAAVNFAPSSGRPSSYASHFEPAPREEFQRDLWRDDWGMKSSQHRRQQGAPALVSIQPLGTSLLHWRPHVHAISCCQSFQKPRSTRGREYDVGPLFFMVSK